MFSGTVEEDNGKSVGLRPEWPRELQEYLDGPEVEERVQGELLGVRDWRREGHKRDLPGRGGDNGKV